MLLTLLASCAPSGSDGSEFSDDTDVHAPVDSADTDTAGADTADTDTGEPADTADTAPPDSADTGAPDSGDTGAPDSGDTGMAPGESEDLSASSDGWWVGESAELGLTSGRFVGDLDLDGTDDVAFLTTVARAPELMVSAGYVPGGQPVSPGMVVAETTAADWWYGYPSWPRLVLPAGDMDGDGWPDLWIGGSGELAAVALVLGPPDRWATSASLADADVGFGAGSDAAATDIDLDGDGLPDAAWFGQDDATGVGGGVYLVHGAGSSADLGVDVAIRCDAPYGFAVGDLTGDATPDFLLSFADDVRLVDGAGLPREGEVVCDDVVGTVIGGSTGHDLAVLGDWNGDGFDDWAMADDWSGVDHYGEGVVSVFAGATTATRAGELDAAAAAEGSFVGGYERASLGDGGVTPIASLDGDGGIDLVTSILDVSARDHHLLVIDAGSLAGLNAPVPEGARRFSGGGGGAEQVGRGITSVGDFDGDGTLDLLAGAGWWEDGRGRVFLDLNP